MKKIILLSTITAATLFATNGDHMIGLGVESRALGGTGISNFIGAENALTNPAILSKSKANNEFSFGGTVFTSDVKISTTSSGMNSGVNRTSEEGMGMIPVISLLNRVSDSLVFGLGMYGTAGLGTDWRENDAPHQGDPKLYNMRSSLMLMQFAPSLSFSQENYGLGITGIMQYGSLGIDYDTAERDAQGNPTGHIKHIGSGSSNDFGYGYQLGGYYDITQNITLGAAYKTAIDMEYKGQISGAAAAFGYGSNPNAMLGYSDHLEQPAEIGIGMSIQHKTMTYSMDIKKIKWADAKGYKDFGWENQTVFALGAKMKKESYWLGIGYNYAKSPIPNNTDKTEVATGLQDTDGGQDGRNTHGDTMNLFNYAMFPATVEKAYTIGGGYEIGKGAMLDIAFTLAPKASDTVGAQTVGVRTITTTHSQQATTISIKYTF